MHSDNRKYPALASRDFRIYLVMQFISIIGSQMQMVGLNWHIYILTNSAVALGMIGLVRYIPLAIFSLFGGAAADSFNRKYIQMTASVIFTILAGILAFTTATSTVTIAMIYALTIVSAAIGAFDLPARQSFVPNLVKKHDLPQAMSINIIMFQTATILGPAIGGFVIAGFGLPAVYALNALSYIALIVGLFIIKTHGKSENAQHVISLSAFKESFTFIRSKSILWSTMVLDFFSTFFASATSLIPIYAKDILAVGPQGVGMLYAAPSIGAVITGFLLTHTHKMKKQGLALLTGITIYAIATIIFGISTIFIISFLALMLVGAGDSISTIIRHTIRQLETPDRMRGRMAAINMLFVMGGPQLGEFEAGILAGAIGAPLSVVIGGAGTLFVIALVYLRVPSLKSYSYNQNNISDALT